MSIHYCVAMTSVNDVILVAWGIDFVYGGGKHGKGGKSGGKGRTCMPGILKRVLSLIKFVECKTQLN